MDMYWFIYIFWERGVRDEGLTGNIIWLDMGINRGEKNTLRACGGVKMYWFINICPRRAWKEEKKRKTDCM